MPGRDDIAIFPDLSQAESVGSPTSHPAAAPAVDLTDVAVEIEHTPVLEGLDFTVQRGEVIGVIGANGSGKSTLLQVIATLRRPHRGTGSILGADLRQAVPAQVRTQICLVAHQPALYGQLSLRENLRFVAELFDRPISLADDALATVGLSKSAARRVDRCSHGMVRRADLARALITEPTLLLLDEAHAGLDPAAGALVAHLVAEVVARGGAAVVVAHERDRLDPIADSVVSIDRGRALPIQQESA